MLLPFLIVSQINALTAITRLCHTYQVMAEVIIGSHLRTHQHPVGTRSISETILSIQPKAYPPSCLSDICACDLLVQFSQQLLLFLISLKGSLLTRFVLILHLLSWHLLWLHGYLLLFCRRILRLRLQKRLNTLSMPH